VSTAGHSAPAGESSAVSATGRSASAGKASAAGEAATTATTAAERTSAVAATTPEGAPARVAAAAVTAPPTATTATASTPFAGPGTRRRHDGAHRNDPGQLDRFQHGSCSPPQRLVRNRPPPISSRRSRMREPALDSPRLALYVPAWPVT
jgi:hypothetical protein